MAYALLPIFKIQTYANMFFLKMTVYSNSTCRVCISSNVHVHESQLLEDTPHCLGWLQVVIFFAREFLLEILEELYDHILLLMFFWPDMKNRIITQGNEFIIWTKQIIKCFQLIPRVGSYYLNYHNHNHNHK